MAGQAQVKSVEAIEAFRAALILFISQARPALEEVASDVTRARLWLENDQRRFWETELRQRHKKLEQAQAELLTARLSGLHDTTAVQQMMVHRAQRGAQEAEDKLKLLKRWDRDLDNRAAPLLKEIEQLHSYLTGEMPKAVAYLSQAVKTLDAYAAVGKVADGISAPENKP